MEYPGRGARVRAAAAEDEGKKSHEQARALWTELLARLTHVADSCSQPDTAAQLRSLGVKRTDAILASLSREYAKASQIALSTGAAPRPHEVMHRARDLDGAKNLRQDFIELAQGYRQLIQALALPADCHRSRWLEGRALVHVAQADAMQAGR